MSFSVYLLTWLIKVLLFPKGHWTYLVSTSSLWLCWLLPYVLFKSLPKSVLPP